MSIRANLRRMFLIKILNRPGGARRSAALVGALAVSGVAAAATTQWRAAAPLPLPRTEVAAAPLAGEIVLVGGYLADGSSSKRVDAYSPRLDRWRRLRDLPVAVNHAMAASWRGRFYVVGGYVARGEPLRAGYVLVRGRWRALPRPPDARAAAGAAAHGGRLYVVGGVDGESRLARRMLVLDISRGRWSTAPGPSPREHLAVAARAGRIVAVGGRLAGIDTNLGLVEEYDAATRRWRALPPIPHPRGGTGAAVVRGTLVSAGGEEPSGTIASVYALDAGATRWRRLSDLPSPRHGLGVVALDGRVYAIAGGPRPGLFVSGANEVLTLP